MDEEIKLRMGLDHKGVQQALKGSTAAVKDWAAGTKKAAGEAGEETEKSFVKGTNAAKGFKKLLNEVSETSPVMGSALKLAISPIGGMFAIAAAAIGAAKGALDKFNESLDITAKLNAKQVTLGPGSAWSRFFKNQAPGQEIADFEKSQRDKNNPEGSREALISQAQQAEAEWKSAVKNQGGARVQKALDDAKRVVDTLKEKIADTERTMPADASRGDIQSAGGWWGAVKYGLGFGDSGGAEAQKKHKEYVEAQDQLKNYKKLLAENEDTLLKLNDAEKENAKIVAEKKAAFEKLLDALRKTPAAAAVAATAPVQAVAGSNIDPATGGIAYHGIADRGGVQYRPIRGAIGFTGPVAALSAKAKTDIQLESMKISLEKLIKMCEGEGINIIPKMGP